MQRLNLIYLEPIDARQQQQTPYSEQFQDVYYDREQGLEEAEYVFISGNDLLQRWQQTKTDQVFTVGETGFGTGLNFLALCRAWQQVSKRPARLHFFSVEKHPLSLDSMRSAHQHFPELGAFSQALLAVWHNFRAGFHSFHLTEDITLTLAFGDAIEALQQLEGHIDAWFLDGFAPQRNPGMWNDDLYDQLNRLSKPGTTLATFTAASQVRKGLQEHGFQVQKKPGFGRKREMITAHFTTPMIRPKTLDWHPWPAAATDTKQATIIGGGLAGMCLAQQLKRAGYHTTVVDHQPQPMQRASGNAAAMVMPMLTAKPSPESLFYLRAFEYALRFYQNDEFFPIGVTEHLSQAKQQKWAQTLRAAGLPETLIQFSATAAHYPAAGYVDTNQLAQRLLGAVDEWITAEVASLKHQGAWQLLNASGELIKASELLIVANGINAQQLLSSQELQLTAKHGQTTTLNCDRNDIWQTIKLDQGYVIPIDQGQQLICGATFDHIDAVAGYQPATLHDDHAQRNLSLWQQQPLHDTLAQCHVQGGHAAIRATTQDHLPICGPLVDQAKCREDWADLHHGRHWQSHPAAHAIDSLYILSGLGSRGFTSAPLLAQYLSAMIAAEPLPLEHDLCKIIHPNRFLYRQLKKPQEKPTQ